MMRLLWPDGKIFYNYKWRVQKGLLQDRQDIVAGFPVRQVIIWHRSGGINFNPGYFLPNYEVIYLIAKKNFTLAPKANALGSVWRISQKTGNPHPAPFPPDLVRNCLTAVDQGPVLDPFIGSGTTAVVAEERGLDWAGLMFRQAISTWRPPASPPPGATRRSDPDSKNPRRGGGGRKFYRVKPVPEIHPENAPP